MQLLQLSLVLGLGDEGFLDLTRAWAFLAAQRRLESHWTYASAFLGPSYWGCICQTVEESHAEGVTKVVG